MSTENIDKHLNELLDVVGKLEARNEFAVLIDDFNGHLPVEWEKDDKASYGGTFLKNFLGTGKYTLINTTDKCSGGPWTHEDPADNEN